MSDDVLINIRARDLASAAFNSARNAATGFFKSIGGVGGIAGGLGIGIGISQIISFAQSATHEMLEARKASKQLDAVLRSTGSAAGVTANQVKALAEEFQKTTNFEADLTVRAAAVMLTFTKIGNQVFPEAMRAAADLSAALGNDLQASVIQVGKALNDPIKGITAMSRAGVSFTEAQKEQINALVGSNDLLGAQKIILAELKTEFAGAAEANSDALTRMGNAWGNFQEDMAEGAVVVADAIDSVSKKLAPGLPGLNKDMPFSSGGKSGPSKFKSFKESDFVFGQSKVEGGFGGLMGNLGGAIGRPFGKIGEEIGFRVMPKINQALADLQAKGRVDAAMRGPNKHPLAGGKGSDFFARILSGVDPFADKPKSMDLFDFFKKEALFGGIKLPKDKDKAERDRGGPFGTASRFLRTGVGFDPSTQTAKNTQQTVKELQEQRKQQADANRILMRIEAKQRNVVGVI